jgi:hypothetical protein
VTINGVGLADGFGELMETLPDGFGYVPDSVTSSTAGAAIDEDVSGQTVTFTVVGVDSLAYRVTVGSDVMDGLFSVTISSVGLTDGFGEVVETLPAGFSYVPNSVTSSTQGAAVDDEVSDQTVTFTIVGVDSLAYRVTVGSDVGDGQHTFSGVLKKRSGTDTIGGDTSVTVMVPEPPVGGVSRSLPADPVAPDEEFSVTINGVGLADGFGELMETLPDGFGYVPDSVTSSTPGAAVDDEVSDQTVTLAGAAIDEDVSGQTVTFTVVGHDCGSGLVGVQGHRSRTGSPSAQT